MRVSPEQAVLRTESTLPQRDSWLLYNKFANSIPIDVDSVEHGPAPPYEPAEVTQQQAPKKETTEKESESEQAAQKCKRSSKFPITVTIFLIIAIIFTVMVLILASVRAFTKEE